MRSRERRTPRAVVGLLAGLALVAAACGDDDTGSDSAATSGPVSEAPATDPPATDPATTDPATTDPATTDPATTDPPATDAPTTDAPAGDVPERVVSLSAIHTENMFAIGADDLLVAVDQQSDYPAEALELPNELSGFEPNVEAIAAYEPDLVLIGGDFTGLGDQLAELGIESWDGPAAVTFEDTYTQITDLGSITGHAEEAEQVVADMRADLDEIVAAAPVPDEPLSVYHELDPSYFSADSTTFIGQVYSLFGLQNIADSAEGDHGGYPQLNAEFIVSQDPDMIFLADTECCGESLETVSARPGWDAITAVQQGWVFEMDDDIASRWGPRVVDYAAAVAAALDTVVTSS